MDASVIVPVCLSLMAIVAYLGIGAVVASFGWELFSGMASYSMLYRSWDRLHERNVRAFRILVVLAWPLVLISGAIWLILIVMPITFFRFVLDKPNARTLEQRSIDADFEALEAAEEQRREDEYNHQKRWWPFKKRRTAMR